ncbi:hypothetical protein QUA10_18190, partial [Microcoleus sp. Pol8_D6]
GQFGIVHKKLIKATILPSLLLGHYRMFKSGMLSLLQFSAVKDWGLVPAGKLVPVLKVDMINLPS